MLFRSSLRFSSLKFLITLAATSAATATSAWAQDAESPREPIRAEFVQACQQTGKTLRGLALTETQKPTIESLLESFRASSSAYGPALLEARKNLFHEIHKREDTLNEASVRQAYKTVSASEEESAVNRAALMRDLQDVFVAGQYKKLVSISAKFFTCVRAPQPIYVRLIGQVLSVDGE